MILSPRFLPALLLLALPGTLLLAGLAPTQTGKFPPIVNTQDPKDKPPSPAESVQKMTLPPGFRVTLFAGEPDVQQPISLHVDDKGRLWVAECYTYGGRGWVADQRDRVLLFEDTDNDGHFDKRTVFWDQARNLSSVTTGFGGVWLLCAPNLLFIPDRTGKGVPDGPPEVVLDGFAAEGVAHNIVNGLTWGPDGWLYGRHGILSTSLVGRPGTPPEKRVPLNCAIWRYHPTRKVFEVVTHGTTNPWGLDYDDHGQMFFTNNVNGHLWHVIPGAHFKRMYGEDFNPHLYDLIDQHADHNHWDATKSWTDSREGKGKHGELGGGHSHVGAMIYLGDNFPAAYRNTIFMCNTHGHRVNNDHLVRKGSGYVGTHGKDFLFANNPWFRGIELRYGPDGGVYLADWVDIGECHDHDGVHRTSGRVYKITHGQAQKPAVADVATLSNAELVRLQLHKNDFYVRAARRLLQERAAAGRDMKAAQAALRKMYDENPEVTRKLRALWCLNVTGGVTETWLREQLKQGNEHLRGWAIRLLVDDGKVNAETIQEFCRLGRHDPSGLVRLFLASALPRLPQDERSDLAEALLEHAEDVGDHNLPLMLWYGLEPLVPTQPERALELAGKSRIPLVRKYIARRLTEDLAKKPEPVNTLVQLALNHSSTAFQLDILQGMSEALQGWRKAPTPKDWKVLQTKLLTSTDTAVRDQVRNLGVVFGDGRAVGELRQLVLNANADGEGRRSALKVLIENRTDDLLPLLLKLVDDRATVALAVKGLAGFDNPKIPAVVIQHYNLLKPEDRPEAINTLVARPASAQELLQAVAAGTISHNDISAYQARQIHNFGNPKLSAKLAQVWGEIHTTSAEKKQLITHFKHLLLPDRLKSANLSHGRLLFQQTCASCHKLYNDGAIIGPDLTGSNRNNLDYLLENIIDPSAVVPAGFKMSIVTLKDGRFLNGIVAEQNERTLTVQTQTEKIKVDRSEVDEVHGTAISLMPEGLLTQLREEQVRDLIAYLMAREQVPLPPEAPKK